MIYSIGEYAFKEIALFGFLAVMIPVVLVSVGNFLGLPSPIPSLTGSLIGTLCLLWALFGYGKKEEKD